MSRHVSILAGIMGPFFRGVLKCDPVKVGRLGGWAMGKPRDPAVTACYGHRKVRESDDEVDFRDAADHISWLPVSVVTFAIFLHGYW